MFLLEELSTRLADIFIVYGQCVSYDHLRLSPADERDEKIALTKAEDILLRSSVLPMQCYCTIKSF